MSDLSKIQPNQYAIAEFPEESSEDKGVPVEVVSTNWIISKDNQFFCLWPRSFNNPNFLKKALVNHLTLSQEDMENCGKSKVVIKYISANYNKIQEKLRKLDDMSNSSQNEDDISDAVTRKRVIKIPSKFREISESLSSSDEDSEGPPKPPELYSTSTPRTSASNIKYSRNFAPLSDSMYNRSSTSSKEIVHSSIHSVNESTLVDSGSEQKSLEVIIKNNSLLKEILKVQEDMKYSIRHVLTLVQNIENVKDDNPQEKWSILTSVEQVEHFNRSLKTKEYMERMIKIFRTIGGKDSNETVRRIMMKLMTHDCTLLYNWSGQNNKQSFKVNEKLLELILSLLKEILKVQEDMKYSIRHELTLVQNIENVKDDNPQEKWSILTSVEQVEHFNRSLKTKEYMERMIKIFRTIGGKDSNETVRRIMMKLMTHDCTLLYNWSGQNNKQSFKVNEKLLELILSLLKEILKVQEDMKYSIRHELTLVQNIENVKDDNPQEKWSILTSVEQVEHFNRSLKTKEYMERMIKIFRTIGGKDSNETVRRIMMKLMTHDCTLLYNWSGQNNKQSFKVNEKLLELILLCVRKNSLSRDATQKDIESVIKKWLRTAADRQGGRIKRKSANLTNELVINQDAGNEENMQNIE